MTFAEIALLGLVAALLYFFLRPLQMRLELSFYRIFRSRLKNAPRTVIDITDYSKKKGPDHEV